MTDDRTPVIVGVGQFTQSRAAAAPLDPLGLMTLAARAALDDAGSDALLKYLDTIRVVNIFSHSYADAPGDLARRLGTAPENLYYSTIGGNTPQMYVNKAAQDIAAGRSQAVLIAGAEAGYAPRRAQKGEVVLNWPPFTAPRALDGQERDGVSACELTYGMIAPVYAYALIENRLRHVSGWDMQTHRAIMAHTLARLSKVAAQNPHAWFPEERTADEITTPCPANRMAGFPYTLRMCANLNVDQAAAVLLTSEEVAHRLGIAREKWIYPMGGASLHNVWNIARRPELHTSPALGQAARLALQQAGRTIGQIDAFDFYSCFACAVELARNELGVARDDPRPITLTGGLPYFGGPGNNYSLHAIANAATFIRNKQGQTVLVTALGWLNTKWSVGVYGKEKGRLPWRERDDGPVQQQIDATALPEPVEKAHGRLVIESYTVVHDKSGLAHHLTVIGHLDNGTRAFAFMFGPPETLSAFESACPIGKQGLVTHDAGFGFNLISDIR